MCALEDACWLGTQTVSPHVTAAQHASTCTYLPCPSVRFEAHLSTSTAHHLKLHFPLIFSDTSMGALEDACWLGTQTPDGHQPTIDSSRPWTSSPCILIRFEAHFLVSSSQHLKFMYMSSFVSDGTRELVSWLCTQTIDGHQPNTDSSRALTSSPCLLIRFEAHFPVSSSQHFKLMYAFRRYHPKQDGTLEQECRMGSQTLDGHQPTAQSSRRWT